MKVAITLETDSINQNNTKFDIQTLDFNYLNELSQFYRMAKRHGLPVTTFVRIDEQIAHNMGDPYYVYNSVKKIVDESGVVHEFGWHPHLFHLNSGTKMWSIIKTEDDMVVQLARMHQKYHEVVSTMKGIRVGGSQSGPKMLSLIKNLGFQYDSSCLSSSQNQNDYRWYDWSDSPNCIFYPSTKNYKVGGLIADSNSIGIKEIPITTFTSMANYDPKGIRRSINPTYHQYVFKNAIDSFWGSGVNLGLIVVSFHAEALQQSYEDSLFSYGLTNFWQNLTHLERSLCTMNIPHTYHLMGAL